MGDSYFIFYFLRVRLRHHLQFDRWSGGGTYSLYIVYNIQYTYMYVWTVYINEYNIIYYNIVDELTINSSLHRLSSSSDIRFSCFLKYLRLAACRLNHV